MGINPAFGAGNTLSSLVTPSGLMDCNSPARFGFMGKDRFFGVFKPFLQTKPFYDSTIVGSNRIVRKSSVICFHCKATIPGRSHVFYPTSPNRVAPTSIFVVI
ncbi:hypothetical protein FDUTEX481_08038 [Tolypothrix sp. PCC 7601]|nr:hypothetical protein FDUTEX481_08038 [Tolypothrix sp. PCC 7601]